MEATGEERVEATVAPPLSASLPHYNVSFLLTTAGYWHIAVLLSPASCASPSHRACLVSVCMYNQVSLLSLPQRL